MTVPAVLALRRDLVYEGDENFLRAVHPIPILTRAAVEERLRASSLPRSAVLFREDSFDPVTRVRRGRLYEIDGEVSGKSLPVMNIQNYPFGPHVGVAAGQWAPDSWYRAWRPDRAPAFVEIVGKKITLGEGDYETIWRAVEAELVSTGDLLLTLRAVSSLGALPEIADEITDRQGHLVNAQSIRDMLDRVVTAFHVQQPQPIVDVCRETTRVILAAWIGKEAEKCDLGDLIKKCLKELCLVRSAASIINRLHPRGKSAEREMRANEGKNLRSVVDEDAECSVQLIGMILRDIGWTAP